MKLRTNAINNLYVNFGPFHCTYTGTRIFLPFFFLFIYRLEADNAKQVRNSLLDAREEAKSALEKLSNEAKSAKKNMKFSNLESIESRIQELTNRQHTENMNLKEEKELIREIESLRSARSTLQRVKDVEARAEAASSAHKLQGKDLNNQITSATEIYNAARTKRDAAFEELKRLQDAHNAVVQSSNAGGTGSSTTGGTTTTTNGSSSASSSSTTATSTSKKTDLIKEKQEFYEAMRAKEAELKVLRDEFYSANRNYNNYLQAMRRYQQILASKAAATANSNSSSNSNTNGNTIDATTTPGTAADLESIPVFYAKELNLCDVLTTFLNKLKPKEKTGPTEAELAQAAAEQSKRITNSLIGLNGEKLTVTARSTGDDDGSYTVSKSKKDTKKDTKKGKDTLSTTTATTNSTAPAAPVSTQITLDLEALFSFELLSIPAPLTTADIDTTLQALKNKRKYYETAPPPPHEKSTATATTASDSARSNVRSTRPDFTTSNSKRSCKGLNPKLTVGSSVHTLYGPGTLTTIDRADGLVVVKLEVKETGFYATAILDPEMVKPGKVTATTTNNTSSTATVAVASNVHNPTPVWNKNSVRPTAEVPATSSANSPNSPEKSSPSPRTGRSNRPGNGGARTQRKE